MVIKGITNYTHTRNAEPVFGLSHCEHVTARAKFNLAHLYKGIGMHLHIHIHTHAHTHTHTHTQIHLRLLCKL